MSDLPVEKMKTRDAVAVWDQLDDVRAQFAPLLTDKEFAFFVTLGKSLNANPFKREIWAVKYDKNSPASIFLGRDMYRRRAQEQPDYDGHVVDAVYSKDAFVVENGIPKHSYSLADRGVLLGAYCVVYKKNQAHPFFVFVKFSEYDKGQALWKKMGETLIKKVAESQGLRGAFQGIFAGTYDESEQWETTTITAASKANVPRPSIRKPEPQTFDAPPEREQEPEPEAVQGYTRTAPPQEPPSTDDPDIYYAPPGLSHTVQKLDEAIFHYCNGNRDKMALLWKKVTRFDGNRGPVFVSSAEEMMQKKNPDAWAGRAMRDFEQKMAVKFNFHLDDAGDDE